MPPINRRKKILVVCTAGTHLAYSKTPGVDFKFINTSWLKYHNLFGYTAVILSSSNRSKVLADSKEKLEKFIIKGGILVTFDCNSTLAQCLPYCEWVNCNPKKLEWLGNRDANTIKREISLNHLKFHETWCHGTLKVPSSAKVIAETEFGVAMCIIEEGIKGAALLTTLDPDTHVSGTRSPDVENEHKKIQAAQQLLDNILDWATNKHDEKHSNISYFWRRFLGIFSTRNLFFLMLVFFWPVTIISMFINIISSNYNLWSFTTGSASLLGFAIFLTEKYMARIRNN